MKKGRTSKRQTDFSSYSVLVTTMISFNVDSSKMKKHRQMEDIKSYVISMVHLVS